MTEYACKTCKYGQNTDPKPFFVGRACSKIVSLNYAAADVSIYIVGGGINEKPITLLVKDEFLCKLWEPNNE